MRKNDIAFTSSGTKLYWLSCSNQQM